MDLDLEEDFSAEEPIEEAWGAARLIVVLFQGCCPPRTKGFGSQFPPLTWLFQRIRDDAVHLDVVWAGGKLFDELAGEGHADPLCRGKARKGSIIEATSLTKAAPFVCESDSPLKPAQFINKLLAPFPGTTSDCNTEATGDLIILDTIEGNPVTSIGG